MTYASYSWAQAQTQTLQTQVVGQLCTMRCGSTHSRMLGKTA